MYSKSELLSLPDKEKIELAEELWGSVESSLPVDSDEIAFAEERLKLHSDTPTEGLSVQQLKKYFSEKYGF